MNRSCDTEESRVEVKIPSSSTRRDRILGTIVPIEVLVQQQKQQDHQRETFIALRARRQAYRIATDFLYKDTPSEPESDLAPPLSYHREKVPPALVWIKRGAIVLLTVMAFCVIACVAFVIAEGWVRIPTGLR